MDIKIGDLVRILREKRAFEKGYTFNFSKKIFVVAEKIHRDTIVYKLRALNDNEDLEGIFYKEELSKVTNKEKIYTFTMDPKIGANNGNSQSFSDI